MSWSTLIILTRVAALALVASVALAAWPWSRRNADREPVELQSFLNGLSASVSTPPSTISSDELPDLELAALEPYQEKWGDTLRLRDFLGRTPLVVSFWASWCPPCRREAPLLEAAWRKYRKQLQFIGVNLRDQKKPALAFIQEFGMTFPSGADPKGGAADAFGLVGVPSTYFIDLNGGIQATKVGEITKEELGEYLQALLPAQAP